MIYIYIIYIYICIHLDHCWMKWSITNLIWLPAGQSQREAKMVVPQSQWSDSLTKRSAGSVPLKVPFSWWFSQRKNKKKHFGWIPKRHVSYPFWWFFCRIIWWRNSCVSPFLHGGNLRTLVTIVLDKFDHDLGKSMRYHWNEGDLMAFYQFRAWFWVWWTITVIMYPDNWMKLGLRKIGLLDISW